LQRSQFVIDDYNIGSRSPLKLNELIQFAFADIQIFRRCMQLLGKPSDNISPSSICQLGQFIERLLRRPVILNIINRYGDKQRFFTV
jgi:hypothetical protein